jgi:hypothetical protein
LPENIKVRHHFVPAFYLSGFTDTNNHVWIYDKTSGNVFFDKPKNVGFEKHYHTLRRSDGTKDTNSIENFLCEVWEGPASKIIKRISDGDFPCGEDRQFFACFLGLSFTRSPNYREIVNYVLSESANTLLQLSASESEQFYRSLLECEQQTGEKLTDDAEGLRRFILKQKYKISFAPEMYLSMFLNHGVIFGSLIEKMKWQFVRATSQCSYLTSDNPFFFNIPSAIKQVSMSGVGFLNRETLLSFPINKSLALIATWRDDWPEGFLVGTHKLAKIINRRTVSSANRFVYAPENSNAITRLVNKYAKCHPKVVIG